MAFALQNRGGRPTRHNWNDDVQTLLKWMEENRVTGVLDLEDPLNDGMILVEGSFPLAEINRLRRIVGWTELEAETKAATK